MVIYDIDVRKGPNSSGGADAWARELVQLARHSPPPTRKIHKENLLQKQKLEELTKCCFFKQLERRKRTVYIQGSQSHSPIISSMTAKLNTNINIYSVVNPATEK